MTDMLLVYITCDSVDQAKTIARDLMNKKLCACVNIFPDMQPMFFWPPKSGIIDESKEVVLIAKTIESKYEALEVEVIKVHSYDTPCIFAIPVKHVTKKYYDWLVGEME
jgi:periplasmic divalent cation tolerance protein